MGLAFLETPRDSFSQVGWLVEDVPMGLRGRPTGEILVVARQENGQIHPCRLHSLSLPNRIRD